MKRRKRTSSQEYEKIDLFGSSSPDIAENEVFFTIPVLRLTCVICAAEFQATSARANVCSAECRRLRKLRYGARYRQDVRDLRSRLYAHFGGKKPTEDQIYQLIKDRKGSKS